MTISTVFTFCAFVICGHLTGTRAFLPFGFVDEWGESDALSGEHLDCLDEVAKDSGTATHSSIGQQATYDFLRTYFGRRDPEVTPEGLDEQYPNLASLYGSYHKADDTSGIASLSSAFQELSSASWDLEGYQFHNDPRYHFLAEKFSESKDILRANARLLAWNALLSGDKKFTSDYSAMRRIAGGTAHMIQDFYAHTTWLERQEASGDLEKGNEELLDLTKDFSNLASASEATCEDCSSASGACSGNVKTKRLTSAFRLGLEVDGKNVSTSAGKCSYGGRFDKTSGSTPKGGVNKDTGASCYSPHKDLTEAAIRHATRATAEYLDQVEQMLGERRFKLFMNAYDGGQPLVMMVDLVGMTEQQLLDLSNATKRALVGSYAEADQPLYYVLITTSNTGVEIKCESPTQSAFIRELDRLRPLGDDGFSEEESRWIEGLYYSLDKVQPGGTVNVIMNSDTSSMLEYKKYRVPVLAVAAAKKAKVNIFTWGSVRSGSEDEGLQFALASMHGGSYLVRGLHDASPSSSSNGWSPEAMIRNSIFPKQEALASFNTFRSENPAEDILSLSTYLDSSMKAITIEFTGYFDTLSLKGIDRANIELTNKADYETTSGFYIQAYQEPTASHTYQHVRIKINGTKISGSAQQGKVVELVGAAASSNFPLMASMSCVSNADFTWYMFRKDDRGSTKYSPGDVPPTFVPVYGDPVQGSKDTYVTGHLLWPSSSSITAKDLTLTLVDEKMQALPETAEVLQVRPSSGEYLARIKTMPVKKFFLHLKARSSGSDKVLFSRVSSSAIKPALLDVEPLSPTETLIMFKAGEERTVRFNVTNFNRQRKEVQFGAFVGDGPASAIVVTVEGEESRSMEPLESLQVSVKVTTSKNQSPPPQGKILHVTFVASIENTSPTSDTGVATMNYANIDVTVLPPDLGEDDRKVPSIRNDIDAEDCLDLEDGAQCDVASWSFSATVEDSDSGLMEIRVTVNDANETTYDANGGTSYELPTVSATCCERYIRVTAIDNNGNLFTQRLDVLLEASTTKSAKPPITLVVGIVVGAILVTIIVLGVAGTAYHRRRIHKEEELDKDEVGDGGRSIGKKPKKSREENVEATVRLPRPTSDSDFA